MTRARRSRPSRRELPSVAVSLRPRPAEPVGERTVAFFTTAPTAAGAAARGRARRRGGGGRAGARRPRRAARGAARGRTCARADVLPGRGQGGRHGRGLRGGGERGVRSSSATTCRSRCRASPTSTPRCSGSPPRRWPPMPDRREHRGSAARGHPLPFSKGRMATTLFLSGVDAEHAYTRARGRAGVLDVRRRARSRWTSCTRSSRRCWPRADGRAASPATAPGSGCCGASGR